MFGLRSVMLRQLLLSYLLLVVAGTLRAEANTGSLIHQTEPRLPRLGRPGPPAFSRPGRFEVHELLVAQDDGGSVVGSGSTRTCPACSRQSGQRRFGVSWWTRPAGVVAQGG